MSTVDQLSVHISRIAEALELEDRLMEDLDLINGTCMCDGCVACAQGWGNCSRRAEVPLVYRHADKPEPQGHCEHCAEALVAEGDHVVEAIVDRNDGLPTALAEKVRESTEEGDRALLAWIEAPDWSLTGHLDAREVLDLALAVGYLHGAADAALPQLDEEAPLRWRRFPL